jgi:hypothetical protein
MYIIDFDGLQKLVAIPESDEKETVTEEITDVNGNVTIKKTTHEAPTTTQINTVKYDVFMNLIGVILNEPMPEADLSLGLERALDKAGVEVQIAFNTLEHYGVIKEI